MRIEVKNDEVKNIHGRSNHLSLSKPFIFTLDKIKLYGSTRLTSLNCFERFTHNERSNRDSKATLRTAQVINTVIFFQQLHHTRPHTDEE